jgi:hypothetical protein
MLEGLEPLKNRTYTCKIELMQEQLDPKDYQILLEALADSNKWTAKGLSNALKTRGVTLADTTITRHRTQVCNCFRS